MRLITPLAFIGLVLLLWSSACSAGMAGDLTVAPGPSPARPTVRIYKTQTPAAGDLSNIIADILADPDRYSGKTVEITGYFRGWDLLKEAPGGPPVTRSDWVIADQGGAIYVTGPLPEGLDPASPEEAWTLIRLKAAVESDQKNVYLKAQSVEQLD